MLTLITILLYNSANAIIFAFALFMILWIRFMLCYHTISPSGPVSCIRLSLQVVSIRQRSNSTLPNRNRYMSAQRSREEAAHLADEEKRANSE